MQNLNPRIGTFNVHGSAKITARQQLEKDFLEHALDIAGYQETKIPYNCKEQTADTITYYSSDCTDEKRQKKADALK